MTGTAKEIMRRRHTRLLSIMNRVDDLPQDEARSILTEALEYVNKVDDSEEEPITDSAEALP